MDTTIIITPRERYSQYAGSLRSLFKTIPRDVRVIVFDANAPEVVRAEMREIEKERPYERIETDEILLAPQVRNLGLAMVETKYTCYCDNDLEYTEGWLEALEANAERTGAGAVAPLTLLGPSPRPKIHHAGSEIKVMRDAQGRPILHSHHRLDKVYLDLAEKDGRLDANPEECDEFEYHCAFIRTDVLREMGGHDERQTKHDHLDDSLRVKMLGHKITFERNAVILYRVIAPFAEYDWDFFFYRWSREFTKVSEQLVGDCWGVRKNYPEAEGRFLWNHYRRAAGTVLPTWTQRLRPKRIRNILNAISLKLLIEPKIKAVTVDSMKFRAAPMPPKNALELAGIPGAEILREGEVPLAAE
ncbi:MAG: glycosyltransferase [Pseudomonadota bacterium]